jgi:hypothetical protein
MEFYIEFILVTLITVTWIWGFEYTFKEGEVFGRPGQWMRANLPEWVLKPTIDCKYCMSSVHGTAFFLLFLREYPWWMWVMFLFCLCGTTAIFDNE